ncbi:hypothetical protein NP493_94g01027 [Ridgeia piscesae]|uniref:Uncharacterized protein n=1 Tax=Ridgeia piscesae TaxID=27915 RepID=A0AAD9UHU4_RIDPI|nr:hypothetical protein NP493_94g01027 [Ridgeia piscesae]
MPLCPRLVLMLEVTYRIFGCIGENLSRFANGSYRSASRVETKCYRTNNLQQNPPPASDVFIRDSAMADGGPRAFQLIPSDIDFVPVAMVTKNNSNSMIY